MGDFLDGVDLPPSDSGEEDDFDTSFAGEADASFTFRSVRLKEGPNGTGLARFIFSASNLPGQDLVQQLQLPFSMPTDEAALEKLRRALFNIGLVLLLWPWMCFGHKRLIISAGPLSAEQVEWWRAFYRSILAEWAAANSFGLEAIELELTVDSAGSQCRATEKLDSPISTPPHRHAPRVLCPLGGGKDSLVVFDLLREQPVSEIAWLYVGDGIGEFAASKRLQDIVAKSGARCHVLEHDLGQQQLARACGHANLKHRLKAAGHPWAALVAFDAALVSLALDFDAVAVGNERSANFGNGIFLKTADAAQQLEVNHQFDKSFTFEQAFHDYARRYVCSTLHHFSPLQRLWELQIAWIFCQGRLRDFHGLFISCNNSSGNQRWCLTCDKCCFVAVILGAFLTPSELVAALGRDLLAEASLLPRFQALLDLQGPKPMECVGEPAEVLVALAMASARRAVDHPQKAQQNDKGYPQRRRGKAVRNCDKVTSAPAPLEKLTTVLQACQGAEARRLLADGPVSAEDTATHAELYPSWWTWPSHYLNGLSKEAEKAEAELNAWQAACRVKTEGGAPNDR